MFPAALLVVVALGTLLVVFARENRSAEALEPPLLSDHWHSAYGIYICDQFLADLPEFIAPQNAGNHTHGDGLLHIHPFSSSRTGDNATLSNFFDDAGEVLGNTGGLGDDSIAVPGGETFSEGDDTCDGDGEAIVQVAVWNSAQAALDGDDPAIVTDNVDEIRFGNDGEAFTVAFAPEGADIPPPPSTGALGAVGSDLGVPTDSIPEDAEQPNADDPAAEETDPGEETDPADDTDATTEADDSSTTTEADADQ